MQKLSTVVLLIAALTFIGCAKKQSTMRDPEPASASSEVTPPPSIAHDLDLRARELREQVETLESHIRQLPGNDDAAHRAIMQRFFADLTQTLPMVVGPESTGAFGQQLRIIQSAQTQLASGSSELAAEPTIDTGLRAAQNALASAQAKLFYESKPIAQTMEQLRGRIAELDSVRGPMHRLVVTQASDLIGQTLGQMTDEMETRSAGADASGEAAPPAKEESEPAPAPAKGEEAEPAEEPAAPKEEAKPAEEDAPQEEAKSSEEPAPAEDAAPAEDDKEAADEDAKPAEEAAPADDNDMNK